MHLKEVKLREEDFIDDLFPWQVKINPGLFKNLIAPLCDKFPASIDLAKLAETSPQNFKPESLHQIYGQV